MRWSLAAGVVLVLASAVQAQSQPPPVDASGLTARTEIAEAGSLEGAQRVLRFVQVSDAHILDDDAPYPLRQEPLDPYITAFSSSAQRPQDEFTDEVLESVVRAINAQHAIDPFQFVLNTGDNIDNDLENELMRFLDLWDGTSTTTGPISGLACLPDGQSTSVQDTAHDVADQCTSLPEALVAQRTALAAGLPWYSAFGNHDALIQGNVNPNQQFDEVAAQNGRHLLTQPEYVDMHFPGGDGCGAGTPADDFGHGYGLAGERLCDDDPDNDGYYAFELGGVRFVVLDTLNDDFASANGFAQGPTGFQGLTGADVIGGYAEGAVDPAQAAWMAQEIADNPTKLVVVASHHTVNSMFSSLAEGYCNGSQCLDDALTESGYKTGPQMVEELSAAPNVVGWLGGHTHRHRIQPKTSGDGGFWNIESSSLIDWPQEARVVELWVTADGAKGFWLLRSFGHDFQPSKDLELTDPQRVPEGEGTELDRDVILWFDVPAGVVLTPMPPPLELLLTPVQPYLNSAGEPAQVRVGVTARLPLAVGQRFDGTVLDVTWGVSHAAGDGTTIVDVVAGSPLEFLPPSDPADPVAYFGGSFLPTVDTTYTFNVSAAGPNALPAQRTSEWTANAEWPMGCDLPPCPGDKKGSPPLPAVALLGLALAMLARRR